MKREDKLKLGLRGDKGVGLRRGVRDGGKGEVGSGRWGNVLGWWVCGGCVRSVVRKLVF